MKTETENLLEEKISRLQEYMAKLSKYVALDDDTIIGNDDKLLAMERAFQLVVDEAIDINAVVTYQLSGKVPDSYKSSFYELVPLGLIDQNFADMISECAKIRNQLTHEYEKLSSKDIVISIKKFFEMYKTYFKIMAEKFIKKDKG